MPILRSSANNISCTSSRSRKARDRCVLPWVPGACRATHAHQQRHHRPHLPPRLLWPSVPGAQDGFGAIKLPGIVMASPRRPIVARGIGARNIIPGEIHAPASRPGMKLLVGMNISPALCAVLSAAGWESIHWSDVGDRSATDSAILEYAKTHGYVVLTHDLGISFSSERHVPPEGLRSPSKDRRVGFLLRCAPQRIIQRSYRP